MHKLAIVIPAYKGLFFQNTLESIANQTNNDFTLYIGDDCSPDNLYSIVNRYEKRINIIYKRFEENIGSRDLVGQWERCIDLVQNEEWIWLFSDDDFMDATCVEDFFETLKGNPEFDLFHFNVEMVDESDKNIVHFFYFPEILSIEEFILGKLRISYFSTVVEYVFRRSHFISHGRFQNFDLAWCSDDATWIKLGKAKGIRNIENSRVYWRKSIHNISMKNNDLEILLRKFNSQIEFSWYLNHYAEFNEVKIKSGFIKKELERWFLNSVKYRIDNLSYWIIASLVKRFNLIFEEKKHLYKNILGLYFFKIYRSLVGILKKLLFWEEIKKWKY